MLRTSLKLIFAGRSNNISSRNYPGGIVIWHLDKSPRRSCRKSAQKPAKSGRKKSEISAPVSATKSKHRTYAEGILASKTKALVSWTRAHCNLAKIN